MFNLDDLKKYLKHEGADITSLSDDDLTYMIESTINEIMSKTGLPINPVPHTHYTHSFKGASVQLNHYPIGEVKKITFKGETLAEEFYHISKDVGIIFFNRSLRNGPLEIEYTSQLPEDKVILEIQPLCFLMVLYRLTETENRDIVSIREGDINISYNPSVSMGARILEELNNLRLRNIKIRLL